MVLLLRHSGQVFRVRANSTCECDSQFTEAKSLARRGGELAHRSIRHLAPSSLPLSSAGPKRSWASANSRSQESLHRQAVDFFNPASPPASSAKRRHHQPVGGSSAEAVLESASRSWLNAKASARFVAKIITCMIVCRRKKCRRFTTGWFPMSPRANHPPS